MVLLIVSTIFVSIISFILFVLKNRHDFFKLRAKIGLKGPPTHFFLGNLKEIMERKRRMGYDDSYKWFSELHEKYGETLGIYLGQQLNLAISNEEDIKEIFIKNFSNFSDRSYPAVFEKTQLRTSLLQSSYAIGWKHTRSAIAPIFTTGKMKAMHGTVVRKIETFLTILEEQRVDGGKIDIYQDLQALTLDVIGQCAFAVDSNCQRDRNEVFYVQARNYINNLDIRHSTIIRSSFLLPELSFMWKHLYQFTGMCKSEIPLIDGLSNVYERRKAGEGAGNIDLLKLLIDREDAENKPMTKQEVIENCFAFLLAGYETTSTALTYCTYLLSKHQDVQERLYEEIMDTKERKGITYDSIHSMKYLDAVYKETLRVYPPVIHFSNRRCLSDITIRGQLYPKGAIITCLPHTVHMNENNWENAKEFIPDRFLDWNDKGSLKWIPFGVGPRFCVGMRFAEMEFKTTVVMFLERYRVRVADGEPDMIPDANGVVMRPKDPIYVTLEKR